MTDPDQRVIDPHDPRVEVDLGPAQGRRLADPDAGPEHQLAQIGQVLADGNRVGAELIEPALPLVGAQ